MNQFWLIKCEPFDLARFAIQTLGQIESDGSLRGILGTKGNNIYRLSKIWNCFFAFKRTKSERHATFLLTISLYTALNLGKEQTNHLAL